MTADIRTAAQREAGQLFRPQEMMFHDRTVVDLADPWREAFVAGAVWAQARLTPTREQVERALIGRDFIAGADAILALLAGLAEGDSGE